MRVVLGEDLALLRDGLIRLLCAHGFEVVDVSLPPTFTDEGLRTAIEARHHIPGLPVLVLSQYVEQLYARELLSDGRGGIGYLVATRTSRRHHQSGRPHPRHRGVGEDEIQAAMRRYSTMSDTLWHFNMLLRPHDNPRMMTEFVFRAHCRELLERVATGADTCSAIDAEICCMTLEIATLTPIRFSSRRPTTVVGCFEAWPVPGSGDRSQADVATATAGAE